MVAQNCSEQKRVRAIRSFNVSKGRALSIFIYDYKLLTNMGRTTTSVM